MPHPPPDSTPHDPETRLSVLEHGLTSLTSRCDDLARLLNQLLDSARLASQRRSSLIQDLEALTRRVGALEEGRTRDGLTLREIVDRLATTVPVQNQLDRFSSDLVGLSTTLNQEFSALEPRLIALEMEQTKAAEAVTKIQQRLEVSEQEKDQLDGLLSAEIAIVPAAPAAVFDPSARLMVIEQQLAGWETQFQKLGQLCSKLEKQLKV